MLDDIVGLFAVIWVAQKVAAFAAVLSNVVGVLGAASAGLQAFMVEMTVATGGTFALVAAIGTLVAGCTCSSSGTCPPRTRPSS